MLRSLSLLAAVYCGAAQADPLNLYCRGFYVGDGSGIAFHITLDRRSGAASYAWGKEYFTGCDDITCLLNHPRETPHNPTEQISIDRLTGAYRHSTVGPFRVISMSEEGGCVVVDRKF